MKKIVARLKEKLLRKRNLRILYVMGFMLAVATAVPTYIESSFIEQFVSAKYVGLFFASANVITFFAILFFPEFIERFKNHRVARVVILLNLLSLLGMFFANSALTVFLTFILLMASFNLIWINMDIFVEEFTAENATGQTRTTYFTFMNLGWIVSPILTSYFINNNDYRPVYLLAAFFLIPFYFIFAKKGKNLKDRVKYDESKIFKTFKTIWKNKNIRGIFFIAFLLQIFYSLAVVYVPIYLNQTLGIPWTTLGIIFSIMLIPFVLFEIPAGIIADKYIGEKEILTGGFIILIIALILFFAVSSTSALIWGAILFFSRIGAALVEAMRESYFFKMVTAKDLRLINFFRTTQPLGYLFGTVAGVIIIRFLPINYIFLIAAGVLLSSFYFISTIKDTK